MSQFLHTATVAVPLAGWGAQALWARRQIDRARRDPLTGLLRRDAFEARAERLLRRGPCVVLLVDIDDFKTVNDTYGHAAGDAVLSGVAWRLTEWLRTSGPSDGIAGRIGGDEFVVCRPVPLEQVQRCARDLAALHEWLRLPQEHDGTELPVSASVGALWTGTLPTLDLPRALRCADEAMYRAKQSGDGVSIAAGANWTFPTVTGRRAGRTGACRRAQRRRQTS